ncbi:MAG TPA: HEAT repeat domain-containing protein [Ktedonobacterales bacterium]
MTSAAPSTPAETRHDTYIGPLLTTAIMAALATLLVLVLLLGRQLTSAIADLQQGPAALAAHLPLLMMVVAGPLVCATLAAFAMWRVIWITRVTHYMRVAHDYCGERLRRDAPLIALGFPPMGQSLAVGGEQRPGASRSAPELAASAPQMLLLGESGSGKTTALLTIAQSLSARPLWVRVILGVRRESLPVLVALPGLARSLTSQPGATASALIHYVAALLERMGTEGLGARAERLLRAGRLTLLCDDYDKLDDDERETLNLALRALREAPYSACRIVVACETTTYASVVDDLGPLAQFSAVEIAPIPGVEVSAALQRRENAARRRREEASAPAESSVPAERRPLGVSLRLAAISAALVEAQAAGVPLAWGRAELLRAHLRLASATATVRDLESAVSQPDEDLSEQPALVWAAFAASLQDTCCGYAPLDPTRTVGESVFEWLANHPPPSPTDFTLNTAPILEPQRIERDIQAGLRVGLLRRSLDGLTLSFAHTLAQASAAAWWLDLRDDGLGRLNSQLLRPQWALPVALWTGAHGEPYDLAQRIFRFANSPGSVAPRAGVTDHLDVYPQALALALAAVLEGAAPHLSRIIAMRQTRAHAFILAQQGMRDFLDACVVYGADPAQRPRLSRALARIQSEVGIEFPSYLGALARESALDRMPRAQITTTLGLCATPQAIDELMSLLLQSDPTMRQALDQALVYSGANAIPALQTAVRAGNPHVRQRAEEALRLLSGSAPAVGEAASGAAIAGLVSPDAAQRRAAVTTLSAIGASAALNDLIARLDDTDGEVRLATVAALGQLGGRRALLALRRHASSDDPQLRLAVAQALGVDPAPASTATLLRLLKDSDAQVRAAAATALGAVADKRAIAALREASEDADPWVRHAAQTAVRRFTHP